MMLMASRLAGVTYCRLLTREPMTAHGAFQPLGRRPHSYVVKPTIGMRYRPNPAPALKHQKPRSTPPRGFSLSSLSRLTDLIHPVQRKPIQRRRDRLVRRPRVRRGKLRAATGCLADILLARSSQVWPATEVVRAFGECQIVLLRFMELPPHRWLRCLSPCSP